MLKALFICRTVALWKILIAVAVGFLVAGVWINYSSQHTNQINLLLDKMLGWLCMLDLVLTPILVFLNFSNSPSVLVKILAGLIATFCIVLIMFSSFAAVMRFGAPLG